MTSTVRLSESTSANSGEASPGRLPDFLIIGAMKSGTTTLYEYLRRDPRVFMADPKEPMFFSRDDVYQRGMDWYRSLFAGAAAHQLCGESSTCYSRRLEHPHAAQRIRDHLPDARFIYIMRHPVERAYSVYRYIRENRWPDRPISFDETRKEYNSQIIDSGIYIREIEHLLELMPRDRFLFLILDDLHADPAKVLNEVDAFLGLPPGKHDKVGTIAANRFGYKLAWQRATARFNAIRRAPVVSTLVSLVPKAIRFRVRRSVVGRWARRDTLSSGAELRGVTPLSPQLRAELLETFEPSLVELECFLGRELPSWHK